MIWWTGFQLWWSSRWYNNAPIKNEWIHPDEMWTSVWRICWYYQRKGHRISEGDGEGFAEKKNLPAVFCWNTDISWKRGEWLLAEKNRQSILATSFDWRNKIWVMKNQDPLKWGGTDLNVRFCFIQDISRILILYKMVDQMDFVWISPKSRLWYKDLCVKIVCSEDDLWKSGT